MNVSNSGGGLNEVRREKTPDQGVGVPSVQEETSRHLLSRKAWRAESTRTWSSVRHMLFHIVD